MKAKLPPLIAVWSAVFLIGISGVPAQDMQQIQLPQPRMEGGKPLMQVLKERKSAREFSTEKLAPEVLSDLLWAAFGITRPDGRRTAPSASNKQEIDVYVATADGLFLYDAQPNVLKQVLAEDIRALAGTQDWVKDAPVNLIYVADLTKAGRTQPEAQEFYSGANTAFIAENVYLYCTSAGLATVVRASIDRAALGKAMKLRTDQKIALAQSVGYPKK